MKSAIGRCPYCGKLIYGPSISDHIHYGCKKSKWKVRLKIKRTESNKSC